MSDPWAAAGEAGKIAGGIFGAVDTAIQRKKNREREDNAIQRRSADMEAAGLSKTLAAGSAAAASPQPGLVNPLGDVDPLVMQQSKRMAKELTAMDATIAQTKTATDLLSKQARNAEAQYGKTLAEQDAIDTTNRENNWNLNRSVQDNMRTTDRNPEWMTALDKTLAQFGTSIKELPGMFTGGLKDATSGITGEHPPLTSEDRADMTPVEIRDYRQERARSNPARPQVYQLADPQN